RPGTISADLIDDVRLVVLHPQVFEEQRAEHEIELRGLALAVLLVEPFDRAVEGADARAVEAEVIDHIRAVLADRPRGLARAGLPESEDTHLEKAQQRLRGVEHFLIVPWFPVADVVFELLG